MNKTPIILALLLFPALAAAPALAQSSANFRLEQSVFNAAGHPSQGVTLSSASYEISLDSLGEGLASLNLSSGSYRLDSGWTPGYRPPGLVQGLRFISKDTMEWNPASGADTYNLYRNKLVYLDDYGPCFEQELTSTTATDLEPPTAQVAFYYLVTAENSLDEEGSKDSNSAGTTRGGDWCP